MSGHPNWFMAAEVLQHYRALGGTDAVCIEYLEKQAANGKGEPDPTVEAINALRSAVVAQTALLRSLSEQVRIGFEAHYAILKANQNLLQGVDTVQDAIRFEAERDRAGLAERLEKLEPSKELDELRQWKREAIEVMPDYQEIGKILGLKCGDTVHDKIIPALRALQSKKNQSLTSKNSKHGAARRKAKR